MKPPFLLLTLLSVLSVLLLSCNRKEEWKDLFNGEDLRNWDMHTGTSLGSDFDSLAAVATIDKVFSVIETNGEKVIRISGEINGALATKESFENYHLKLVFRWGDKVYSRQNSGLLYHSFGDFGQALGTWMPNIEFQLMHQNLGDTYLMANTCCETSAVSDDDRNMFFFTPGAVSVAFGEHASGRSIKKSQDAEKPVGEWNTVDLYCFGTTSVHVVNGITVMVNNNTGVYENGAITPLKAGKIQIQSEGAEFYIKSIAVRPIKQLPDSILP